MTDEKLSPEEQAAMDAGAATIEDERTWTDRVEARLAALEDKAGLTKKADTAEKKEETK